MKRIVGVLLVAFLGLVTACAPAAAGEKKDDAVKEDLAKLQGEWKMVSGVADGYAMPDTMVSNCKRVCKGDELTVTMGGQLIMKAKVTLDPTQSPKAIDYQVIDGPTKGKKHLGIYEIDGETLKSCFGAPDAERPKDFESKQGDKGTASVWKRTQASQPDQKK